jgi:RNA polymerase sigma-70 factor (ECF subfamily)
VSTTPRYEFDDVYTANVAFVWRVLRGMGVTDALVDDAAQDVFVVVHRRLPEFDGRFAVKTWLFEIAYRVACDYRRKSKRAASHAPLGEDLRDRAPSPADSAAGNESLHLLEELLDGMDNEKRAVLVLSGIEGMTAPEIAAMTATPLNTVYTRLRRARAELSDALAARERSRR